MNIVFVKIRQNVLRNKKFYILSSIMIFGGILRFWYIGSSEFWFDEIVSIQMAKDFFTVKTVPNEALLYFKILAIWIKIFGTGEGIVRSLSAIFDICSIYLIFICGKQLIDKNAGLLAAFIYTLAPFSIWYAREARNYSLSVLFVLLAFYFFLRVLKNDKNIYWTLFLLSIIFGIYTACIIFVIIPIFFVAVMTSSDFRKYWRKTAMILTIALLISVPYIMFYSHTFSRVMGNFWIPAPTLKSTVFTLENFNLGYTINTWGYFISHLFFTIPFIFGVFILVKRKHVQTCILMEFLFLPILIIYFFSHWITVYLDRKLLICVPFYYLILSYGIKNFKPCFLKVIFIISITFLSFISLFGLYNGFINEDITHHLGAHVKRPISNVVKYINNKFRNGDIIANTNYSTALPFHWYGVKIKGELGDYLRKGKRNYFFYSPVDIDEFWFKNIKDIKIPDIAFDVSKIDKLNRHFSKGIWVIQTDWSHNGKLDSNSKAVRKIISSKYKLINEKLIDGVLVSYYQ